MEISPEQRQKVWDLIEWWGPLDKVLGYPAAREEYESLVDKICGWLASGQDDSSLAHHIAEAVEQMGAPQQGRAEDLIVRKIREK